MQSIQNGITETILQPIPIDQPKNNPMSEIQQISSPQKITQEQTPSSIKYDAVQNLQQQKQSSISIFDKKTMGDNLNKALDTVANDTKSIENQESQSSHIGNDQHTKALEKALETPYHEPTENAPQISSETPKTEGTTITKEIFSGHHPHLDETTNKAVQSYFNPEQKEVKTQDVENLISYLKDENIIDQKGKINFEKLGLDKKTIKKAGIKGEIFIKDGAFDFKISGKCSLEAQECLKALNGKLETLKGANNLDIPININPASVGPLSAEDQAALANGGQIQYRTLPNGDVMKLTLDPGSNGENDGLKIDTYDTAGNIKTTTEKPIPLNVVFQGAQLNGKKVGPFLPHWREEKLFENSVIHTETNSRGTKIRKTNEDDVGRIQTQNKLWNAVFEYLKASVEITEGHFDINNDEKPSEAKNKQDTKTVSNEDQPTSQSSLNIDTGETHELSNSTPASFSTELNPEIATSVNETSQTVDNTEENTQQQAQKSYSLGTNTAVDINEKVSFYQTNEEIVQENEHLVIDLDDFPDPKKEEIPEVDDIPNSSPEQLTQDKNTHKSNTPIQAKVKPNINKPKRDNNQHLLEKAKVMKDNIQNIADIVATTDYNTFLINFDSKINTFQLGLTEEEKQTINQTCNDFKNAIKDFKNQNEQLLTSEALEVYFAALAPLDNNTTLSTEQKIETMKTILQPATKDLNRATKFLKDKSESIHIETIEYIKNNNNFMSQAAIGFILLKQDENVDPKEISYRDAINKFEKYSNSMWENFSDEINL